MFSVGVDTLAAVRGTKAEEDQIFDSLPSGKAAVLSVIAFRGQNRSEARYVRSASATTTKGIGIVSTTALLLQFCE